MMMGFGIWIAQWLLIILISKKKKKITILYTYYVLFLNLHAFYLNIFNI